MNNKIINQINENEVYSNKAVKAIRQYIKRAIPTVGVRQEGTWIDILGSDDDFGYLTESESLGLFELGIIDKRLIGTKQYSIDDNQRKYLLKLWGLLK